MDNMYYFVAYTISFKKDNTPVTLTGNMEVFFTDKSIESIEDINAAQQVIVNKLKEIGALPTEFNGSATITNFIFLRRVISFA